MKGRKTCILKDKLGEEILTAVVVSHPKSYSYKKDNNEEEKKKAKGTENV